jgi:cytoskeletal protein CcmA (bactofilin family)
MWNYSLQGESQASRSDQEPSERHFKSILDTSAPSSVSEALSGPGPHSHGTTIIGKLLVVRGELSGNEAMVVDGEVEASITLPGQRLTVRPNGHIRGNIQAREVILHGLVEGDIQASDRVELFRSASLTGCILTARISIEDGAFIKGKIDIKKPEPALMTEAKPRVPVAVTSTSQQDSLLERAAKRAGTSWYK